MQFHELSRTTKQKRGKRIGRGGKRGTYSGRGGKGQTARAGSKKQPVIRELIKRYPKLRGYRAQIRTLPVVEMRLDALGKKFKANDLVNPESLLSIRLIRMVKGRMPVVKILGTGTVAVALRVEGCELTEGAKKKIEQAGGTVAVK